MNDKPNPTIQALLTEPAIAQTESKQSVPPPTEAAPPWLAGSSLVVGGAALWAVAAKLLDKYGNSALSTREQKIKQDLDQSKGMSEFYLHQANRDAETIDKVLNTFVSKHLDANKQMFDMYYELLERYKKLEEEMAQKNEELVAMRIALRDIFEVLSMRERQSVK